MNDFLALQALDCDEVGDDCDDADILSDDDLDDLGFSGSHPPVVGVDIDGGFGSIVYEVEDNNPIANEDCTVPVWFGWEPDTGNDLPAPGTGQLAVTFAPLSTAFSAEEGEPVAALHRHGWRSDECDHHHQVHDADSVPVRHANGWV